MTNINWIEEVHKRKEALIRDTQAFLQINSVYDNESIGEGAPMGLGIAEALKFLLYKAQEDGFNTRDIDGYAAHIEYGEGQDIVGVLCHIDVVPEGEGWTSPPFSAEIREGKIFARGAIDDKGPTMAAYYALKIVKELGVSINKRVRIIIGTDEERNWQCVKHYFKQEEMPSIGFAPDADFPIIYAEKGIANFYLVGKIGEKITEDESIPSALELKSFQSGQRVNMVPDQARATIEVQEGKGESAELKAMYIIEQFQEYIKENEFIGTVTRDRNQIQFLVKGSSAHGAEPYKGTNAGFIMNSFLRTLKLRGTDCSYVEFVDKYFTADYYGEKIGITKSDEMTGPLTINVGVFHYVQGLETKIGLNLRYPVTTEYEVMMTNIRKVAEGYGFSIFDMDNSPPHHVDKENPLIKTLQKVYYEQTSSEPHLLSIGGGTYARSLKSGVAFGPLFPGKEETAHQKDEFIEIDDLLRATSIYAQAIYELAMNLDA
jgi:succinyl-diaminopimelate desuccinylase